MSKRYCRRSNDRRSRREHDNSRSRSRSRSRQPVIKATA
jgi:hypothetical protein